MSYIEKFWRDATAADVTRVMSGETVEARFRDCASDEWKCRVLIGWSRGGESDVFVWASAGLIYYRFCQVYAPPQWFINKPDPGEEFRLLGKFPDEALQPGDEGFNVLGDGKWEESLNVEGGFGQSERIWYRRRIEQPKPEPKFAVGQRVKIIGPVCGEGPIYNWTKEMDQYIGVAGAVRLKPTQDPEGTFYAVGDIVGWSFREDYLEAVVEPEPKYKVGQRVKIIGPKRSGKVRYNWEQGMDNQVGKTGVVTGSHDGSFGRLYQSSGIVEWNFQEDYLEAVIEPEPKHYVLRVGDTCDVPSGHRLAVTEHGVEVT